MERGAGSRIEFALYVWRSLRPEFWLVCIFPLYMGFAIASRSLLPEIELLEAVWRRGIETGISVPEIVDVAAGWLSRNYRFVFAILCLGPFIWGSTLLFNDVHDLPADRKNPRRQKSPLVAELVTQKQAMTGAAVLAAAGLLLSALISTTFLALMAACLALSYAYSAPPLRLKGRAGFDLLVNVLGIGALCTLAGWSLARPIEAFPFPYLLQPVLLLASAYVPTTMVDHPYDAEYGFRTISVGLGIRRAFWLGLSFSVGASVMFLITAWAGYVVTWRVFEVTWPLVAIQTAAYFLFYPQSETLAFRRVVLGILAGIAPFALGQAIFLAHYTGYLTL